ncbi:ribonucleotide-diphosphate reductase subunit beta [Candidatus Peregrinibacteria bacterium]|nr:MAG: ribonucleotide-diphosphate reductase subunit beta [Candidatus Peregrinibacteria bacterium]
MGKKHFAGAFADIGKKTNAQIINERRIINGEDDGLMQVAPLKHPFADDIYKKMLANTWVPTEVQMARDIEMWTSPDALTEQERFVYKRSLAFISNLDGIQTNNLVHNIARHITSPEVKLTIVRQAFEEALHVHSYATMIEALSLDPEEIYGLYRTDQGLYEKNAYILRAVDSISDPAFMTGTFENDQLFLEACVGNIILEGIYFYSAFLTFYILKRNNKMPGSAEMIAFINRDENLHLANFIQITNTIKEEQPELWTPEFQEKMRKNIKGAIELELDWGKSCIHEGILGLNPAGLEQYLQFIGNMRCRAIGLDDLYPAAENPFPWIDEMTQSSMTEVNFFEGRVREYSTGTLEW